MEIALVDSVPLTTTVRGTKIAHALPGLPGGVMASALVNAMDGMHLVTTGGRGLSEGGAYCAGFLRVVAAAAAAATAAAAAAAAWIFRDYLTRRRTVAGSPSSRWQTLSVTGWLLHSDFTPRRWH